MKDNRYDCAAWSSGTVMRKAPIWIFQNSHLQWVCVREQQEWGCSLRDSDLGAQGGQGTHNKVRSHSTQMQPRWAGWSHQQEVTFQRVSGQRGNRPGIKSVSSFPHSTWETGLGAGAPTEQLRRGLKAPSWCSPCSVGVGGGPKWGWPGHLRTISALRALTQYHLLGTVTLG